jgi:hypothetical protein
MATVPVKQTAETPAAESVEERFRRLEATWLAEVGYSSSSTVLRSHPAFQEIIAMGRAVVPLMLRDLEERPRLWVWALPRITGADPVPASARGNIAEMSAAWLRRGREAGYNERQSIFGPKRGGEYHAGP